MTFVSWIFVVCTSILVPFVVNLLSYLSWKPLHICFTRSRFRFLRQLDGYWMGVLFWGAVAWLIIFQKYTMTDGQHWFFFPVFLVLCGLASTVIAQRLTPELKERICPEGPY